MDQFDQAQDLNDRYNKQALDEHLKKSRVDTGALGPTNCVDCSQSIPRARRDYLSGCIRCVSCQEKFERGDLEYGA